MAIRLYKAYTPGTRNRSVPSFEEMVEYQPHKKLMCNKHMKRGRNSRGVITSRHRGGGHKRLYRKIDFRRDGKSVPGRVETIEYDPNRNAYIRLIHYGDGDKRYVLQPRGIRIGHVISSDSEAPTSIGNTLPLTNIPLGATIHNIEITPGRGGQLVRSAGAAAKIIAKEGDLITLKLPPGEIRLISRKCLATIGQVGNIDASNRTVGKAGSNRWLGKRPKVRGVVMNPIDHPHGGGEGKAPIGRKKPLSPWGDPALGRRSRKGKKYSDGFILRRRRTG
uniref:Large ribosomal subunit protein uL2c n=1 Tax=Haplomitrium blumei TaxID=258993 RepID=A0A4Y5P7X6_9MARC|nr:ribosomal protein L2 [Haplomitrium blumei]QCW59375.1 ribosomal protein L2 [Haplomitrium blumei]